MIRAPCGVFLIGSCPALLGLAIGKTIIILWCDIAQLAHEIHPFMVAQQGHDADAARLRRSIFQGHHEVQDFSRLWPSIDQVAHLNQSDLATRPVTLLVYEPSPL